MNSEENQELFENCTNFQYTLQDNFQPPAIIKKEPEENLISYQCESDMNETPKESLEFISNMDPDVKPSFMEFTDVFYGDTENSSEIATKIEQNVEPFTSDTYPHHITSKFSKNTKDCISVKSQSVCDSTRLNEVIQESLFLVKEEPLEISESNFETCGKEFQEVKKPIIGNKTILQPNNLFSKCAEVSHPGNVKFNKTNCQTVKMSISSESLESRKEKSRISRTYTRKRKIEPPTCVFNFQTESVPTCSEAYNLNMVDLFQLPSSALDDTHKIKLRSEGGEFSFSATEKEETLKQKHKSRSSKMVSSQPSKVLKCAICKNVYLCQYVDTTQVKL
ncbi:uncharacterized protein LOC111086798 [Limulus polyphemus]|uniref:Uncharacterized protein LOC111086798 n=1 Tax=Limulus polyphemus TaxID=6850 RepID=A0ABM1ST65_LIMPO|nr:uncharacterized protein LOC111086798 [Limulus polyphemus]XP_022246822.1 uncharacterized protein LOC111086798 [Limulus polyphemus]